MNFKSRLPLSPVTLARLSEGLVVLILLAAFVSVVWVCPPIPGPTADGTRVINRVFVPQIWDTIRTTPPRELIFGGKLPVVLDRYHLLLPAYFYLPFYLAFGANSAIEQWWPRIFLVGTALFGFLFLRTVFDKKTALLGLVLLLVHPHFIATTREAGFAWGFMPFFSTGALYFLARWKENRRPWTVCLGFLFFGLGMSTQLWFYWFWSATAVLAVLFRREIWLAWETTPSRIRQTVIALVSLLIGMALLIYREIFLPRAAFVAAIAELTDPENPVGLAGYWKMLPETARYVTANFSGFEWKMFYERFWWLPESFYESLMPEIGNPLFPPLLWISIAALLLSGIRSNKKKLLILPIIFLSMLVFAPLRSQSSTANSGNHMFFIYPFPILLIAVAAVHFLEGLRTRGARIACGLFLVIFLALEVRGIGRMFRLYDIPVVNYPIYYEDIFNSAWPDLGPSFGK